MLFYAIPRRDTKEQAHALDDAFGSLYGALTADEEKLCRVVGIGARTAAFLHSVYPFLCDTVKEKADSGYSTENKALVRRLYPHLDKTGDESSLIAFLNNRDEIIRALPLGSGKGLTLINSEDIVSKAFAYRASSVVIADYKAEGIPFPDDTLLDGVRLLQEDLLTVGVHLRDYLLFTSTQYNSVFFLTNDHRFHSPSPFFLTPIERGELPYEKDSLDRLSSMLALVTSKERADALATDLLTKYSTVSTVFSIPHETLLEENEGYSAEIFYLKLLSELYARIGISRVRAERAVYTTAKQVGEMFSHVIGTNSEETVALGMFDGDMRLIDVVLCAHGSVNTASFVMRKLVEVAVLHRAAYVALSHNHPDGIAAPSAADVGMLGELYRAIHQAKMRFVDHFVVTKSDMYAITRGGYPSYTDMPDSFYED